MTASESFEYTFERLDRAHSFLVFFYLNQGIDKVWIKVMAFAILFSGMGWFIYESVVAREQLDESRTLRGLCIGVGISQFLYLCWSSKFYGDHYAELKVYVGFVDEWWTLTYAYIHYILQFSYLYLLAYPRKPILFVCIQSLYGLFYLVEGYRVLCTVGRCCQMLLDAQPDIEVSGQWLPLPTPLMDICWEYTGPVGQFTLSMAEDPDYMELHFYLQREGYPFYSKEVWCVKILMGVEAHPIPREENTLRLLYQEGDVFIEYEMVRIERLVWYADLLACIPKKIRLYNYMKCDECDSIVT